MITATKEEVLGALEEIALFDRYSPLPRDPAKLVEKVKAWHSLLGDTEGPLIRYAVRQWYGDPKTAGKALTPGLLKGFMCRIRVEVYKPYRAQLDVLEAQGEVDYANVSPWLLSCSIIATRDGISMDQAAGRPEAWPLARRISEGSAWPRPPLPQIIGRCGTVAAQA